LSSSTWQDAFVVPLPPQQEPDQGGREKNGRTDGEQAPALGLTVGGQLGARGEQPDREGLTAGFDDVPVGGDLKLRGEGQSPADVGRQTVGLFPRCSF
jgi:hypothetical protein